MANGKITAAESIDSPAIVKGFVDIDNAAIKVLKTFNALEIAASNIKTPTQGLKFDQQAVKLQKQEVELLKKRQDLQGKILINQKRAVSLTKEESNASAAKARADKAITQAKSAEITLNNKLVKINENLSNRYKEQSTLLNKMRNEFKSLGLQKIQDNNLTAEQIKRYKTLEVEIKKLDTNLKKVDAAAGQFQRNVGNYPRTFGVATRSVRSFIGAFGVTSGIFLLASTLQSMVGTFKEFDQAQADLSAILGRSRNEISALTKQSKELGATTAFTATQVSALQLELAKLGFSDDQILAATEGVENLAIATGVEAARAAKLAGAALRGFNLDASESNRVAAALAVSTTKSASSFETLETSLPKVSAIAKSFGFTLEDTTALLGGLQNAGFEASIAGTSLRQIFLQLADSNGKLAQRLGGGAKNFDELIEQFKKVEKEGISLGEAFNLTNARSVAAFKVFLQGADDLKVLRDSIVDVEDELQNLADTKLDSLTGDVTLLNSAWEGLILNIEDGNGRISRFFRSFVQGLTDVLDFIGDFNKSENQINIEINTGTRKKAITEELNDIKVEAIKTGATMREVASNSFFKYRTEVDSTAATLADLREELKELEEDGVGSKSRGAIQGYKEDVKDLKDEIKETAASLAVKQGRLDAVNQVIRANKVETSESVESQKELVKAGSDANKIIEGTIAFYKDKIKEEKKFQDSQALTTSEINKSKEKVEEYNKAIEKLVGLQKLATSSLGFTNVLQTNEEGNVTNRSTQGVDEISSLSSNQINEALKAELEAKQNTEDAKVEITRISAQKQRDILASLISASQDLYGIDLQNFIDILGDKEFANLTSSEKLYEIAEASQQTLLSLNDALLDNTLDRLDEERDANRAKLDKVLDDENASDEKKKAAQARYDQQEAEIKRKQFEANKKAAIAQNIINTAVAITQAYAQLGPVGGTIAGVLITALSLVQLANIKKQQPPQFFAGKDEANNYEGLATWNERRPEVNVDKDGNVVFGRNKNELRYVSREDIIVPSIPEFKAKMKDPSSTVYQRVNKTLHNDNVQRSQMIVMQQQSQQQKIDTAGIEQVMERVMMKYANRPFKGVIKDERKGFGY